ncbi:amidase [Novosphingobium mangrovi (ex Hu et al. 2023)]|uniref:Amidase n=1 Tax=Novosphingobium mangrovi (ex Hu et al. 2023) TaxID=2930094 RepID=A0ABT0AB83_9SPHN|nr:amidase [Novosphingobium mangrovi (ex Hu et al. 2023)]MCJ1960439.1 amidase [Novosphingobium mangrovi (ex Hu et al. 2023)]
MKEELADLTGVELAESFAAGSLSPVEVAEDVLARAERLEPHVCATYALEPEAVRAQARASEARWHKGAPLSVIDGIPVTLKELIATKGTPKPVGTAAGDMTPQTHDAPPAQRMREAGAVLLAKTTVPDYGMLSSGLSSFHKLARNPWDLSRNPGGSSAGAGAAAAAGYGPFHVGTDIGGSVRLPAGWCGIFAHKPSNGRIPIDPPYIGRVAGPMTRTVADAALMMTHLSLPDRRDFMDLPYQELPWRQLEGDVAGLRIGLMLEAGCGSPTEPEVAEAVTEAARLFEHGGAIVEPVEPFMTPDMLDGLDRFWRARFYAEMRDLPPEKYDLILEYIRKWVEPAAHYDGMEVYTGFDQIIQMRERGRAYNDYDLLLSPVAPMPAFPAELASPVNDPMRPFEHIGFTVPYNMTEQPASSINCGYTREGLPIGLQIVGRRFEDMAVLRASAWYEKARPAQRPWPCRREAMAD